MAYITFEGRIRGIFDFKQIVYFYLSPKSAHFILTELLLETKMFSGLIDEREWKRDEECERLISQGGLQCRVWLQVR
jgi:hypothetical protein